MRLRADPYRSQITLRDFKKRGVAGGARGAERSRVSRIPLVLPINAARARRRRRGHAMTNESHGRGLVEFHLPHHTKPTRVCHTNPAGGLPPPTAHRTAEQRLRAQALAGRYAPPEPAPAPSSRLADGWRGRLRAWPRDPEEHEEDDGEDAAQHGLVRRCAAAHLAQHAARRLQPLARGAERAARPHQRLPLPRKVAHDGGSPLLHVEGGGVRLAQPVGRARQPVRVGQHPLALVAPASVPARRREELLAYAVRGDGGRLARVGARRLPQAA
mmetsp:Transcript_44324/g.145239  ORF Transcript_44324/g.145239 Transcript_44324/m.145239 type:complete len:272 (-) Transcript_44324:292-1107(-)